MKDAKDLIPWKVTDISLRPFDDYWSFNPSIHFDGAIWRCVLRCCDYAMPDGVTIRSKKARPTGQLTKNAMVIFDPQSWKPIQIYKMHERDDFPRASTPHVGYEDMRIFRTDKGGLQGIAASLHLQRETRTGPLAEGTPQNQPPEQALLSFDSEYNIVASHPIRGDGWSGTPQKNWVPFDHCAEPRFLYSIGKGSMFDTEGSVHGDRAAVRSSAIVATPLPLVHRPPASPAPIAEPREERVVKQDQVPRSRHSEPRKMIRGGGDVQILRNRRMVIDTLSSRPTVRPSPRPAPLRGQDEPRRVLGTGRVRLPRYDGLRGGTQLVRIRGGGDAWLGIGHEMRFVSGKKLYWHTWYIVDSRGKMTAASEPMKLAPNGIEFAAGMAIDGDRVVVSFGVDDMECKIGETQLSAVLEQLRALET